MVFKNHIVYNTLLDCLNEIKNIPKSNFKIDSFEEHNGSDRFLEGIIKHGTGGYASEILEKEGNHAFSRKSEHLEVLPFYFQMCIPSADRTPILCIQQFSGRGIYSFFKEVFIENLKKALSDDELTVQMFPIYVGHLYLKEYFENGKVKKIYSTEHSQSKDLAGDPQAVKIQSELSISPAKRGGMLASLQELLGKESSDFSKKSTVIKKINEIYELNIDSSTLEELIIVVELNGIKRRINVGQDFGTVFNITDEVPKDSDGHPITDKLEIYVTKFISSSLRPYIGSN